MPSRARSVWRLSTHGQYVRQIGWTVSRSGKRTQAKFRLGCNRKEAIRRDQLIRQLWDRLERQTVNPPAVWSDEALAAAKAAAATGRAVLRPAPLDDEQCCAYVRRVAELKAAFEHVDVQPVDEQAYRLGSLLWQAGVDQAKWINYVQHGKFELPEFHAKILAQPQEVNGPTLHDALRSFIRWLQDEYADPEREVTAWGRTQIRRVGTLMDHHANRPLSEVDFDAIEEMVRYWRKRPISRAKRGARPITKDSAENYIKTLKGFLRWLHRSKEYAWVRPLNLDDIKTRVETIEGDRLPQLSEGDLFTIDELSLLYKYATPLERTFLLLSLNCHFGAAEISSLLVGEVFLRTPPLKKYRELLGIECGCEASFIRRFRRKTGVYGEWMLFPETVDAIEAALARRAKQIDFGPGARLMLTSQGKPYDAPTASGNANNQIANRFASLIGRIQKDGHKEFVKRPFKMVRKTAATMIREIADGEIQGLFTSHGQPVPTDDLADVYAVRPFGKLFAALSELRRRLEPVFARTSERVAESGVQ
jgi:hypothetical protein